MLALEIMRDFKFDSSGDLVIDELRRIPDVEGIEKAKQEIVHILKCIKGTDAFHPDFGVDWLTIKQAGFNKRLIEHEIRKALSTLEKIESIRIEISEPDAGRNVNIKLYLTLDSEKIEVEVAI